MKIIACIIGILFYAAAGMAREEFTPWDSDVAVGDELVAFPVMTSNPGKCCDDHCAGPAGRDSGVYDAFTGGALLMIRSFQIAISPMDGPSCRFAPTCSAYGKIAVQKHGALLGGMLAGDRILRCNIFSKPGIDPVPEHIIDK